MKLYEFFNVPLDTKDKPKQIGRSKEEKESLANEIFYFIIDHDDLHKEFVLPFAADIKDKITSAEFNKDRFTKSWEPMVNKGCNLYHKKEKLQDNPKQLFDKDFIDSLTQRLADKFFAELKDGRYQVGDHTV